MSRGVPLDREALHQMLWKAADRSGKLRIFQKQLAVYLGIAPTHMSRVIRDFEEEGRIKKIGSRYRNVGIYAVRDPAEFTPAKITGLG